MTLLHVLHVGGWGCHIVTYSFCLPVAAIVVTENFVFEMRREEMKKGERKRKGTLPVEITRKKEKVSGLFPGHNV